MRLAALLLLGIASAASAQALQDPTRPPGSGGVAADQPQGMVLQSIILSSGRSLAVIDGRTYRTGDKVGEARIAAISANSVTLRESGKTKVLTLLPDSVTRSSAGADKQAGKKTRPGERP